MRIISGIARGTKLFTLDGKHTRPTLDRVKESFFNIIQNDIRDSVVLDLFSGSGAIGLEFASRGAKKVYLCDNSKEAILIIEKNIAKTHLEENVELFNMDYLKMINKIKGDKFDFIYLDPPYKTDYIILSIQEIIKQNVLNDDTVIIIETDDINRIIGHLEKISEIKIIDKRKYGRANIIFLKKITGKEE